MTCLLCMYRDPARLPRRRLVGRHIKEAITIKAGTAVCAEHEPLVHDPNLVLFKHNQKRREGKW